MSLLREVASRLRRLFSLVHQFDQPLVQIEQRTRVALSLSSDSMPESFDDIGHVFAGGFVQLASGRFLLRISE